MPVKEWPTTFKVSAVLAIVSLVLAILIGTENISKKPLGYILVGLWVLVPPVWFLLEYEYRFPKGHGKPQEEVDRLKHLHELSRNIWLAFIVVLAAIMGIKWPVE